MEISERHEKQKKNWNRSERTATSWGTTNWRHDDEDNDRVFQFVRRVVNENEDEKGKNFLGKIYKMLSDVKRWVNNVEIDF